MLNAGPSSSRFALVGCRRLRPVTAALPLALLLAGCGDSKSSPAYLAGGGAGGAAAGAGGAATGATSAGTTGLGAAGANASAGSGTIFGAGGAAVGGTAGMGTAGAVGQGGQGNGGDNAGNGGTGGAPAAVYTIVGCAVSGVGGASAGAGGASAGAGGASAGAGGASAGSGGKGGAGGAGAAFASFSVYDWVTDKPVQTCLDKTVNFTITVSGDAPLTVVANFAPGAGIGSVVFTYDGVDQPIQDIFPYALAPDNNGDFSGPTPPLAAGKHTLAIAAYDQPGALGNLMGRASVVLTVVSTGP